MQQILSRLSDKNITDIALRNMLYSDIREYRASDGIRYEIKPDEAIRPDLTAHRVYGTPELMWCCQIVSGMDDLAASQEVALTHIYPTKQWLRDRIRYYQAVEQKHARTL